MPGESIEQEKAAARRRWLTLAELLAVAAVLISALTLWDNHSDRARERVQEEQAASRASAEASTIILRGTPDRNGERIAMAPLRDDQAVQAQTISLPTALAMAPVDTAGDPRIEADWFASGFKKAVKPAGDDDSARGDERLPVLISTRYLIDGNMMEDQAIYDLSLRRDGQFLGGEKIRLRGLSLVSHVKKGNGQAQLDARWRKLHPQFGSAKTNPGSAKAK